MYERPWWVYVAQITLFAGAVALHLMLLGYAWSGVDNPNLPFSSDTARMILFGWAILLTLVLVVRWSRDKSGGLLSFFLDLMWWT